MTLIFRRSNLALSLLFAAVSFVSNPKIYSQEEFNVFRTLVTVDFDVGLNEHRKRIAKALYRDLKSFEAYIPALKPDQIEWLTNEEISLSKLPEEALKQKHETLVRSDEYRLRSLHQMIANILVPLSQIIEDSELQLQTEMALWAWTNWALTDYSFDEVITNLTRSGIFELTEAIENEFGLSNSGAYNPWLRYNVIARQIQKEIVIPMCLFPSNQVTSK
jgi:hypothetical protein